MSVFQGASVCFIIATLSALVQNVTPYSSVQDESGAWTTQETLSTTEKDKGMKFWQLLSIIVLGSVLGFLILAVIACACYVCSKMKDRKKKYSDNHDIVYEEHYSSKKLNDGNRSRVVAVKTDQYRNKPEPFWGVQHAVAASLDQNNGYGYNNGGFRNGPENGGYGGQPSGYSPVGGKPRYYR